EITPAQFQRLIVTSRADKLEEQAAKWTSFQAGAYDAVIVTPQAFVRTQLQETAARDYLGQVAAIQRSVKLEQRNAQHTKKPSERQRAILKHGVEAWMRERLELPKNLRPVPGVTWDAIGVDLLLVDEAADYKNLYMPEPREGDTPKYMGSGGSGSARAWHLDARANTVRQRTGGAGVVLLT
ncbi:MAG: hypothetical protein KC636_38925, partial [Myxococcales bacterium]|nr:hypothetical protein [Myxococcales bacterium]